jgi:transposase-like protein
MMHKLRIAMVRPGRIRLHKVNDASGQRLIPAIIESVQPNSEVFTDAWEGYSQLASSGYKHRVLRKTSDVGKNLLPSVNLVASLLKRWLQGTHQGSPRASHLEYYVDEFVFRFDRRTSRYRGLLFYRLIQQAVNLDPVKGRDIRGVALVSKPKPYNLFVVVVKRITILFITPFQF